MPTFQILFFGFPVLGKLSLEVGEAVPVAAHQGEELEGVEVARDVAFGFRKGAEEPTEVKLVGPDRDVDLVPAQERDGGTDAMDRGAVGEVALEVEAQALLRTSAYGDDDVLGTEPVESLEKSRVGDGAVAVHWRHVNEVFVDDDSLFLEPRQVAFGARGAC